MPSRRTPNSRVITARRNHHTIREIPIEALGNTTGSKVCGSYENRTCSDDNPCLRHQKQSFEVTFKITTDGGPLVDPVNFHQLWGVIAKKSKKCRCRTVPKLKGYQITKEEIKEIDDRCSICLCDFEEGDIVTKTPCKHVFHKKCLLRHFKNDSDMVLIYKCPICRKYLTGDHKIKQSFHISSKYSMNAHAVVCDQEIFDLTPRLYRQPTVRVRRQRRTTTTVRI
tara:strand:- start:10155 stop:10829 length:675 start_codon:yes stop_codon:yes gene_type:complete